jgi:hypothetical protein
MGQLSTGMQFNGIVAESVAMCFQLLSMVAERERDRVVGGAEERISYSSSWNRRKKIVPGIVDV